MVVLLITLLLLGLGLIMAYREYYRDGPQNTPDLPPPPTTHTRVRVLRSPQLWHDIRAHRLAVALYGLYWLVTMLITVASQIRIYPMPTIVWVLHLIVVIAAAVLVAWWRDDDEKAVPVCLGVGALISVVEIWAIMLAGDLGCWLAYCPPVSVPADEEPARVFLLVLSIYASVIGLVLGLLGWLVAVRLRPVARWLRGRGGPAAPTGVA